MFLTCFPSQYLYGWYSFCNSCRGDPERSPLSQVCTETRAPHHLYNNNSTDKEILYTSQFTVSAARSVFIWMKCQPYLMSVHRLRAISILDSNLFTFYFVLTCKAFQLHCAVQEVHTNEVCLINWLTDLLIVWAQVTFLLYAGWSSGAFSSINVTQNVDLL